MLQKEVLLSNLGFSGRKNFSTTEDPGSSGFFYALSRARRKLKHIGKD
jgi:hypothetical protein